MTNSRRTSKTSVVDKSKAIFRMLFSRPFLPLLAHGMVLKLSFLMLFINGFLVPLHAVAQEPPSEKKVNLALNESTKADLLLFWEEKDLYVESATRAEKPLTQAAENITVVTAKEIEDMNAHSVAEVLNRVTGVFVQFQGQDFVSPSLLKIQGSEPRQVTVLLDGVFWNSLSDGSAETFDIPVRIIDRIEIVKGPASSTWGSSLGGVINIITKETGETATPRGTLSASYGEANSQEFDGELYGKAGTVGYYLYAGKLKSGGLRDNRAFDRNSVYAKVSASPANNLDLLFTVGYSDPSANGGNNPNRAADSKSELSNIFVTGALDYRFNSNFGLHAGVRYLRNGFDQPISDMNSGQLLKELNVDEETVSGDLRLTYKDAINNVVLGSDISHGVMDYTTTYGAIFHLSPVIVNPTVNKWAVFVNDTLDFGKFSVTPGIRFDHNNISGSFVSPSIGATFQPFGHTTIRASVARGFTYPPLAFTSVGGPTLLPNPNLRSEDGWSYQAGAESGIADFVNAKVTIFRHETHNAIVLDQSDPFHKVYRNGGDVTRQGYELEAESVPLWNLSLKAGHAFVRKYANDETDWKQNYSILVGVKYDDRKSFMAQLTGYYIWWNEASVFKGRYDNFIWDLNLNKRFFTGGGTMIDAFLTVRNLFNGAYYTIDSLPNARRWVEGGIRFSF